MRFALVFCIFPALLLGQLPMENQSYDLLIGRAGGLGMAPSTARSHMAVCYEVLFGTTDQAKLEDMYLAAKHLREKTDEAKLWTNIPKMDRHYKKDKELMRADLFLNEVLTANTRLASALLNTDPIQRRANLHSLLDQFPLHLPTGWATIANELALDNTEGARLIYSKLVAWEPEECLWPTIVLGALLEKKEGRIDKALERLKPALAFSFSTNNPAKDWQLQWEAEIHAALNDPKKLSEIGAKKSLLNCIYNKIPGSELEMLRFSLRDLDSVESENTLKR